MESRFGKLSKTAVSFCLGIVLLASTSFASNTLPPEGVTYEDQSGNVVINFLTEQEGFLQFENTTIDFNYLQDNRLITFQGEDLPQEFRRTWVLFQNGKTLNSGDGRITTSARHPHLTLVVEENLTNSSSRIPRCSYLHQSENQIHGNVVDVRHIYRGLSCPYPWERYTFADGYKCDYFHPCH